MISPMNSPPGYPSKAPYMLHMPCGAPVKEQVNPFGDAVKIDPEGPDVKYMNSGGQLMQKADLKPPMPPEEGDRMAFADQSQGPKKRLDPSFKNEDPSIPKRRKLKNDSDPSGVTLDTYNSDLSLKIHQNLLLASPYSGLCFAYMWHGVRATFGFTRGRVCFEVKLDENISLPEMEIAERHPHVLRVGWSLDECGFTLGEEPFSWGYDGTAKASTNLKFKDYGCQFKAGDVVGAFLDLDMEPAVMSFTVNGNHQGIAYELGKSELKGRPIFPHILTKNIRFWVNFGDSLQPMAPVLQGYTFVGKVPLDVRVRGSIGPASKNDCEALMMIGLPASGKTTWVDEYTRKNRRMKYNVLGTNNLLDKMKVDGLARKRNYSGRWDQLIKVCMDGFSKLLDISHQKKRNYIIDQTNLYRAARKRKMKGYEGFIRRAIVLCPKYQDLMARMAKLEREEGKDVPDLVLHDMKATFSLPDDAEPFDSIGFIEICEKEARLRVLEYNGIGRAKLSSIFGTELRGKKFRKILADSKTPAAASESNRGGNASNRGKGLEGFARSGEGSSSSDRGGGIDRGGGPDRFSRDDGSDGFGSSTDSSDRLSRGDGGNSNLNDFTQRGSGVSDKHGKRSGLNQDITHSSTNHDASEVLLSGEGPDVFNRGRGGGIAGFGRARDFSNSSRGQVSDRCGIERAPEDNNRPIVTDHYSRGGGSDRHSRGDDGDSNLNDFTQRGRGGFDKHGKRGDFHQDITHSSANHDVSEDVLTGARPDCFNRSGGGIAGFGRGRGSSNSSRGQVSDRFGIEGAPEYNNRPIATDHYSRGGGSDGYSHGSVPDSFCRGGGADTYGRGGGPVTYSRDSAPDSYGHGGAGGSDAYGRGDSDTYGRGGGSNSYSQGRRSDSDSRGGGSDSYGRGGGSDSYSRGSGSDSYSRGDGSDSYSRGSRSDSYHRGGRSDSYGCDGRSDSCGRADGPDTHGRRGSDSLSGGAARFARDGDAADTSLEFKANYFNPVGYTYNRDSQSSGVSQDRSAVLGDANGRGSSSFSTGGYGNQNRAGGYGNAADVDKHTQSSEYRASCASTCGWEARARPPALGRGDAFPWKASPPPSAPMSRDRSAASGYPLPAPQQQVWSSQPQGYGGYRS